MQPSPTIDIQVDRLASKAIWSDCDHIAELDWNVRNSADPDATYVIGAGFEYEPVTLASTAAEPEVQSRIQLQRATTRLERQEVSPTRHHACPNTTNALYLRGELPLAPSDTRMFDM